jgi:predicted small secreted protein
VANAWGSENVRTKASMCFKAILLAPSKFALFEVLSVKVPTGATSSILHKKKKQYKILTKMQEYFIRCPCNCKGDWISTSCQTYRPMLMLP